MRHRCAGNRLGRTTEHRIAMTRNMANSMVLHERIVTTLAKAKAVKPFVEKMVTLARKDTPPNRRRAFMHLNDKQSVKKLFAVIGPRFAKRDGGYCRILKLSKPRLGDNGARAILEFVERTPKEKPEPAAEAAAQS
jgi:large subunit ribosomal protein L17